MVVELGDPAFVYGRGKLQEAVDAAPGYEQWCVLAEDTRHQEMDLRWCVYGPFGRVKAVDAGASLVSDYQDKPFMVIRLAPYSRIVPS